MVSVLIGIGCIFSAISLSAPIVLLTGVTKDAPDANGNVRINLRVVKKMRRLIVTAAAAVLFCGIVSLIS